MGEVKIPKPGEPEKVEEGKKAKARTPEPDYSKEIEGVKSNISGLRTEIKDISGGLSDLAEEKGVEEVLSECPECKVMLKPERMGEHLLNELEPKIRGELEPKIRRELEPKMRGELEPKMREELKEELKPEAKEVPKIPQAEFRKTITGELDEYRKDEVDKLKPGILEAEKILQKSGLIKSEGEK